MDNSVTRHLGANGSGLPLAEDLMTGADAIAAFMFGSASDTSRRRVYHAADKLGLPAFKLGGSLCARRSTILKWIEKQEGEA